MDNKFFDIQRFVTNIDNYRLIEGIGSGYIYNQGHHVTITGWGNDTISNYGNNVTIKGIGAINIYNHGSNVSISSGDYNDTVKNGNHYDSGGSNVTINAGKGNDHISLSGGSAIIQYAKGDGNDTIFGFNSTDTLQITGSTYSTKISRNDLIVNVGDGSILLSNAAATLSNINIEGTYLDDNTLDNHLISYSGGNDTITNHVSNVTIDAGAGNDYIYNSNLSSNVTISSSAGNDTIYNEGNNIVYQYAEGDGNDTIFGFNSTDTLLLTKGSAYTTQKSGNDLIINVGGGLILLGNAATLSNINIEGGIYFDTIINNTVNNTVISGSEGKDYIENRGALTTINGGAGNDSIYNYVSNVTINSGEGNDTIYNNSTTVKVDGGDGADYIDNGYSGSDTSIVAGAGKDTIYNFGKNVTIDAGDGDDSINNTYSGSDTSIVAGAGNDTITNSGANVTIDGGNDNDSIRNYASNVTINAGEGDDTIYNTGATIKIDGGEGDDIISNDDYGSDTSINGGAGNDTIYNYSSNVTISGGSGNDTVRNGYYSRSGTNVSINTGDGNDVIENFAGSSTIYGGDGNDTIYNTGATVKIDGGAGNDLISLSSNANKITISGGTGDDTIYGNSLKAGVYQYFEGEGNDTIFGFNSTDTLQITGSTSSTQISGNNLIVNVGDGSILLGNAASLSNINIIGKTIKNTVNNTLISGTEFQDTITNRGSNVTINAGDGNDNIDNEGSTVRVDGGEGNDHIINWGSSSNVTIDGGDGNDYISNLNSNVTIDGGAGNDTVYNSGSATFIIGGAGNDSIYRYSGKNITINAGEGDDTISLNSYYSGSAIIQYAEGDGNDTIFGFNSTDTLQIIGSPYSTQISGNDLIVNVGDGSILLSNMASLSNVDIAITYFDPNIYNEVSNTIINGSAFDESVQNYGNVVSINTDAGNDMVFNHGSNVTIVAGSGSDSINNYGSNVTIDAGAGDDFIYNTGSNVQIDAGKGNDIIYGANESDTVIISGTVDSVFAVDNDLKIQIGDGSITLKDFANKSINSNFGILKAESVWTINGTTAVYGINKNILVSVTGLKDNASVNGISLNGTEIILSESVLDKGTVTVSEGYTLKLADDVTKSETIQAGWSINGKNATYKSESTTAGYSLSNDGKSVTYSNEEGGNILVSVTGLKDNASVNGISLNGTEITLSESVLDKGTVTVSEGYTLKLADDVTKTEIVQAGWSINGTTATYKSESITAGYTLSKDGKSVTYSNEEGGNILVSVMGLKDNASVNGISLNGTEITLSESVLDKGTVTVSEGYTLKLADDVTKSKTIQAGWSINGTTASYKSELKTSGYTLSKDGKSVSYSDEEGGNILVSVTGLKENASVNGISLNGTEIILSESVLNKGTVTVSEGYTLKLADDVTKSEIVQAGWTVSDGTATYKAELTTAGYTVSSDGKSVSYSDEKGGNILVSVTGLKENALVNAISLNGTEITLSESVLDKGTVTVSEGYTLKLADDVTKSETIQAGWSINGKNATYKSESTTAGYSLSNDGKSVTYSNEEGGNILVSVTGLKENASVNGISLNGTEITLSESVLDKGTVTVSEGYTLKLADDVTKSKTIQAGWSINGTTASYKSESTTSGYTLSKDGKSVSYSDEKGGNILVSVMGLKENASVNGISLNGTEVTLSESVLDKGTVTVSEGYTLKLADDVDKVKTVDAKWYISNGTATYKSGKSAGYSIVDNKIIYSEESYNEPLITISGLNVDSSEKDISLTGKTLTIAKSATGNSSVSISADNSVSKVSVGAGNFVFGKQTFKVSTPVEFNLNASGEVTSYKLENAGSVENEVGNVSILGSTGNDTITNSGVNVTINGNGGNDVISGFGTSDKLIIGGTYSTVNNDGDLIITSGNNSITLKDSANISVNIQGTLSSGNDVVPDGVSLKNGTLTVTKNFAGNTIDLTEDWATDVKKTNATAFSKPLTIIGKDTANSIKGGKGADTISGGAAKDTIYGSSGNDLIFGGEGNDLLKGDAGVDTIDGGTGINTLTGGAGKDVFIHSEGEDVITDYVAGQDKIMVNSVTGDSLKGSDIILFTENGNITVKGGKNKKITIVDGEGNSTTQIYGQYNYSESNTKLALTSGFSGTLNADDYDSAVEEINATAITKSGRINGNGNNNIIVGSARNDSINGNGERNTLTGANGNDVFIHEKGDDYITDYTAGKDKVKLLGVTITSASIDENDLILQTTEGTITIAEGKGKKITVVDAKNKTTTAEYPLFLEGLMYDKKNVVLTATTDFTGETIDLTDYYSTTTRVNANAVKTAIEIYGNDNNNSIKGGKGSDTIYGGKGNDTITGGTGKDIFVYEKGDDVITDYKVGQDKIKFENVSITGSTIKSSNVILQTNEGTLTIKNGRNKKITVIDSAGNETTQIYGNSSALLEDNLFVEDVTLDEITEIETGVNLKFTEEKLYEQPELVIVETDEKTNLMK